MFTNCGKEIKDFYDDEVTIPKDVRNEMRERRDTNRGRLKNGLAGKLKIIGLRTQGSYAMRTMVQSHGSDAKSRKSDVDIDDGIYFEADDLKQSDGTELKPATVRQKVKDAIGGGLEVKVKKNCVRIEYAAGYHVDIPAYKKVDGIYKVASDDEWKESDPRAITEWFNNAVKDKSPDEEQLRRITCLLKYFSKSREHWKGSSPSGFILSVLAEEYYSPQKDRDDLSFYETLCNIYYNRLTFNLEVYHPRIPGEKLTKEKDTPKMEKIRDRIKEAIDDLASLNNCSPEEALKIWGKVFNRKNHFSSLCDLLKAAGLAAPAVLSSVDIAKAEASETINQGKATKPWGYE